MSTGTLAQEPWLRVWVCYQDRWAGLGRTRMEAEEAAGRAQLPAPLTGTVQAVEHYEEVTVLDRDEPPAFAGLESSLVWYTIGWLEDFVDVSAAAREILELARAGRYASAMRRWFRGVDEGLRIEGRAA